VRGAHDNAVFVGQFWIQRVILAEAIIPHGGPKIIGAQAQQQFENIGCKKHGCSRRIFHQPSPSDRALRHSEKCRDI